jgi:hypothetical protein
MSDYSEDDDLCDDCASYLREMNRAFENARGTPEYHEADGDVDRLVQALVNTRRILMKELEFAEKQRDDARRLVLIERVAAVIPAAFVPELVLGYVYARREGTRKRKKRRK